MTAPRTNNLNNCGKGSGKSLKTSYPNPPAAAAGPGPLPAGPAPPQLITLIRSLITGLMKANRVEIAGKQLGLCCN